MRTVMVCGAVAAALLGWASATAAESGKGPWVSKPVGADWRAAQPPGTPNGGRAVIRCRVEDSGALEGCQVIRETPSGNGFGKAMLSLAPKYRMKPPGPKDAREVVIPGEWYEFDTPPDWLRRPTAADLHAVVPREAARRGIGGRATISCIVTTQGTLNDCVPLSESPVGEGFGSAALALAPQLLMKPARRNGQAVTSTVSIPVQWPESGMRQVAAVSRGGKRVLPPNLAWAEAPSFADVVAAYPEKARAAKVAGNVTLACDMTEAGRLDDCSAGRVSPGGQGFEGAAKALAKRFRFAIATDAERKTTRDLSVHLSVTFDPAMLDAREPVVGKPNWAAIPGGELLTNAFGKLGVKGTARAVLSCKVQQGGALDACSVLTEDPAGAGTGAAALSLVPAFRLTTWTTEGLPTVGATVRIPIRYEGGEAAKPAP